MTLIDGNTLQDVSATALWTLHNRASETKRPDGVIGDPWAVTVVDAIDYDYLKFGKPNQSHALRAVTFDAAMSAYLRSHPRAAVVALAEGLQSSFWRLDTAGVADDVTWYSVDLPAVMELRRRLLPGDERIVELAQSALDRSWIDGVLADSDQADGIFITAEGLLMYLEPHDVRSLIADCAARFPGGRFMFDSIPPWMSRKTMKGLRLTKRYQAPPMPFGISADAAIALADTVPGVAAAHDVALAPGRGLFKVLSSPTLDRLPAFRRNRPSVTLLEFG